MTDTGAGLSPKHAAFVDEFLKDRSATAAAQRAGYSVRTASTLMTMGPIKDEIKRRLAAIATDVSVTVKSLLAEAEVARETAEAAGNASAMVAALRLKAELSGAMDVAQSTPEPIMATTADTARTILGIFQELGWEIIIRKRPLGAGSVHFIGEDLPSDAQPSTPSVPIVDAHQELAPALYEVVPAADEGS